LKLHLRRPIFFAAFFVFAIAPALDAQSLQANSAPAGLPAVPVTLEDRRAALAEVERDYWDNLLRHSPELASLVGDGRFNDQVTTFTAAAYNDALGREQGYLMQLAVIDPTGFTPQQNATLDALTARFEQDQRDADQKPWETPITASTSFAGIYPRLAGILPFAAAKDYEDWTARLYALPEAIAQATEEMSIGIDDGRVPPREVVQKALAEVTAMARQKPEESPLATPLKVFPPNVSAAERDRLREEMLAAIEKQVEPALLRLEHFLEVSYLPAAGKGQVSAGTREAQLLSAVLDLRVRAEESLGPKFSATAFHDEILKEGLLPVDTIRQHVAAWIEVQAGVR
jgi:uncharacterized protein (DUF885 family)